MNGQSRKFENTDKISIRRHTSVPFTEIWVRLWTRPSCGHCFSQLSAATNLLYPAGSSVERKPQFLRSAYSIFAGSPTTSSRVAIQLVAQAVAQTVEYGLDNWSTLREYPPIEAIRQHLKLYARQCDLYSKNILLFIFYIEGEYHIFYPHPIVSNRHIVEASKPSN